jgi:hypothetical protein
MGAGISLAILPIVLAFCPCIIVCCIISMVYMIKFLNKMEGFNNQTGRFCYSCSDKNINKCRDCFNCGWCTDKSGQGKCIGVDVKGPMNNEKCDRLYRGDDWYRMVENNKNYKKSYGPKQGNRVIGVNPC